MASSISGRVTYANGRVAKDVEVRVFDRDAPGKGDDDLTVTPGRTDARGIFTVEYDPGRFIDYVNFSFPLLGGAGIRVPDLLDILQPYLQFSYTVNGEVRVHTANAGPFQNDFVLPDVIEGKFCPSQHGFKFVNNFPGFELPFSLPFLKGKNRIADPYGLCGGMSAAAADYFLCERAVPGNPEPPKTRTKLHRYLFHRAIDSFQAGKSILRFAQWMLLPDDTANGIRHLTLLEYEKVRDALDRHKLVPLGLVYFRPPLEKNGRSLDKAERVQIAVQNLSQNHQVLAYGYQEYPDGSADIQIYNPNGPGQDDVFIHTERVLVSGPDEPPLYGLRCQERNLRIHGRLHEPLVHGFFAMPYEPIEPPYNLR